MKTSMRWMIGAMALVAVPHARAASVPVTACGQEVQGSGILVADLDCSAEPDEAVKLAGRLFLGGFTLTGNPAHEVVRCKIGRCGITGPGTITGGSDGVRSDRSARIDAGAVITGNAGDGVSTDVSAKVRDATVSGNGGDGVRSKTKATVLRSTVTGNAGDGIRADGSVSLKQSTVSLNGGNGVDSDLTAKAALSNVLDNGFDGVRGLRAVLSSSTATGNGTDPACGVTDECADVASELPPGVNATSTCGTSRNTEGGGTWGVCAND